MLRMLIKHPRRVNLVHVLRFVIYQMLTYRLARLALLRKLKRQLVQSHYLMDCIGVTSVDGCFLSITTMLNKIMFLKDLTGSLSLDFVDFTVLRPKIKQFDIF